MKYKHLIYKIKGHAHEDLDVLLMRLSNVLIYRIVLNKKPKLFIMIDEPFKMMLILNEGLTYG